MEKTNAIKEFDNVNYIIVWSVATTFKARPKYSRAAAAGSHDSVGHEVT